jgi:hypothetical protein
MWRVQVTIDSIWKTWRPTCLGALLILLAAVSARGLEPSSSEQSPIYRALHPQLSLDTRPVSISFGGTIYNVPRNYLVGMTQPQATDDRASFTILTLLPALSPRTSTNASEFDRAGWHDQLRALFQYGTVPRPKEEVLRFYLGIANKSENDFQLVAGRYKLYEQPNNVPHEIYTINTPNGLFLFTCEREYDFKIRISPSCTVMEDVGNKIGATYSFGREHLIEAVEIDAKLRALLNSFAVK